MGVDKLLTDEGYRGLARNIVDGYLFSVEPRVKESISLNNCGNLEVEKLAGYVYGELEKKKRSDVLICSNFQSDRETYQVDVTGLINSQFKKS